MEVSALAAVDGLVTVRVCCVAAGSKGEDSRELRSTLRRLPDSRDGLTQLMVRLFIRNSAAGLGDWRPGNE